MSGTSHKFDEIDSEMQKKQTQLTRFENEKQLSTDEIKALEMRIEKLRQQSKEHEEEIPRLDKESEQLNEELNRFEQELQYLRNEQAHLEQEYDQQQVEQNNLEENFDQQTERVEQLEEQMKELDREKCDFEEQRARLEQRRQQILKQIYQIELEAAQLAQQLEKSQNHHQLLQKEIGFLEAEIDRFEYERKCSQDEIKKFEQQKEEIEVNIPSKEINLDTNKVQQAKIEDTERYINHLINTKKNLTEEVSKEQSKLEVEKRETQEKVNATKSEIQTAENQMNQAQKIVHQLRQELEKILEIIVQTEKEIEQLDTEKNKLQRQLEIYTKERANYDEKRERIRMKLDEKTAELETFEQEQNRLQKNVTQLENELDILGNTLHSLNDQRDKGVKQLECERTKLKQIGRALKIQEDKQRQTELNYYKHKQQMRENEIALRLAENKEAAARTVEQQASLELEIAGTNLATAQATPHTAQVAAAVASFIPLIDAISQISLGEGLMNVTGCQTEVEKCKAYHDLKVYERVRASVLTEQCRVNLQRAAAQLQQQKTERQTNKQIISQKKEELQRQKEMVTTAKMNLEQMKYKCKQKQANIEVIEAKIKHVKSQLEKHNVICQILKGEIDQYHRYLQNLVQNIQKFEQQIEHTKALLKEIEIQLATKQSQLNHQKNQQALKAHECDARIADVNKQVAVVQEKHAELTRLDNHLEYVQANLDILYKTADELEQSLAEQKQKWQETVKERQDFVDHYSKVKLLLVELDRDKQQAMQAAKRMAGDIERQRATLNEKQLSRGKIQTEINERQLEVATKLAQKQEREAELHAVERQELANKEGIQNIVRQIYDTERQIHQQTSLKKELKHRLYDLRAQLYHTENNLKQIAQQLNEKEIFYAEREQSIYNFYAQIDKHRKVSIAIDQVILQLLSTLHSHQTKTMQKVFTVDEISQHMQEENLRQLSQTKTSASRGQSQSIRLSGDVELIKHSQKSQYKSEESTSVNRTFQNPDENKNIIISCFDVKLPDNNELSIYEMNSSDNPFQFITNILSVKNKTIYLIISASKSECIIPIIHKHYCIEKIYLYGSTDTGLFSSKPSMFEKISGSYENMDKLCKEIISDIKTTIAKPWGWHRSSNLFTMLYTQRLKTESSFIELSDDISTDELIVIFQCDSSKPISLFQRSTTIYKFTDSNECVRIIKEKPKSQIFLVISGSKIPSEMQSISGLQQIHALYFFGTNETIYPINKRKVAGLFKNQEELIEQLYKDIAFYRQQFTHITRVEIFSTIENIGNIISHLNQQQISFLISNLFLDILPQVPLLEYNIEDMINMCDTTFSVEGEAMIHYIQQLYEKDIELKQFIEDPKFPQIVLRLSQADKFNDLLILQKQLARIQKQTVEPIELFTLDSVYTAKIISQDTLPIIQSNIGQYINIGILTLASKSLVTARSIAREAATNGLISILFQIELVRETRLFQIDFDRVIFPLGSVFRLESIDQGPDGVYYVKIRSANSEFQSIKQQIQFETEIPLSWLTYGNYLYFLKQFEKGKNYFEYLLKKLPPNHTDRLSIHNNLALIYTMENKKDEMSKIEGIYDEALKCLESIKADPLINNDLDKTYIPMPPLPITLPETTIDQSTVLDGLAQIHYQQSDYKAALENYKHALALSTDRRRCCYYLQMIETIEKHDPDQSVKLLSS